MEGAHPIGIGIRLIRIYIEWLTKTQEKDVLRVVTICAKGPFSEAMPPWWSDARVVDAVNFPMIGK